MKPFIDIIGKNICMVMAYTGNAQFIKMSNFASKVNGDYCQKHGYGFRVYREGFDNERHPSWSKILFVRDTLKDYPWVMWVDSDAIVTNPDIQLTRFIDDRYMMVVGKQNWNVPVWNKINFGIFLVKNEPDVGDFFDKVWDDFSRPGREGWEQDGVRLLISSEPYKSRVKVVCRRDFNSLIPHEFLRLDKGINWETEVWQKGDFIAHYGCKRPDVLSAMKETLSCK